MNNGVDHWKRLNCARNDERQKEGEEAREHFWEWRFSLGIQHRAGGVLDDILQGGRVVCTNSSPRDACVRLCLSLSHSLYGMRTRIRNHCVTAWRKVLDIIGSILQ
jgi:hypothetical protein